MVLTDITANFYALRLINILGSLYHSLAFSRHCSTTTHSNRSTGSSWHDANNLRKSSTNHTSTALYLSTLHTGRFARCELDARIWFNQVLVTRISQIPRIVLASNTTRPALGPRVSRTRPACPHNTAADGTMWGDWCIKYFCHTLNRQLVSV